MPYQENDHEKSICLSVMAILSPAMNVATGGPVVPSKEIVAPSPSSYFRANELDLGAFLRNEFWEPVKF
ncbi:MAG TPA: hypothetical protein VN857_09260 [Chthoniobacterales bacterium]|jgi:hypothetical protein|nr:hypothetical protein [Chthoniobacterales bacterium]